MPVMLDRPFADDIVARGASIIVIHAVRLMDIIPYYIAASKEAPLDSMGVFCSQWEVLENVCSALCSYRPRVFNWSPEYEDH